MAGTQASRQRLYRELGELRTGMADMRSEFSSALRLQLFSLLGAMFTLAGLTWAATSIT